MTMKSRGADQRAAEIMRLMTENGWSQKQAAQHMGLSESAASKCLSRFRARTGKAMALSAPISEALRKQFDEVVEITKLASEARAVLDLIQEILKAESANSEYYDKLSRLKRICTNDPSRFLTSLMAEVRKQVELHFTMRERWLNMERVVEFQRVVMEEIHAESPETAQRIVARLVQTRTLRDSIDLGMNMEA